MDVVLDLIVKSFALQPFEVHLRLERIHSVAHVPARIAEVLHHHLGNFLPLIVEYGFAHDWKIGQDSLR